MINKKKQRGNGNKEVDGCCDCYGMVEKLWGIDWIGLMLIWGVRKFGVIWLRLAGNKLAKKH